MLQIVIANCHLTIKRSHKTQAETHCLKRQLLMDLQVVQTIET